MTDSADEYDVGDRVRLATKLNWTRDATHEIVRFTDKRVVVRSLRTGDERYVKPSTIRTAAAVAAEDDSA